jgi:Tfp pilus assembly pilus retraction ATPase PilT
MAINVTQLLEKVHSMGATDLHLTVNTAPVIRKTQSVKFFARIPCYVSRRY